MKVKNNTDITFQVPLNFEGAVLNGSIQTDRPSKTQFFILNRNKSFYKKHGKVYERIRVYRQELNSETGGILTDEFLYMDEFEIRYALPADIVISESEIN